MNVVLRTRIVVSALLAGLVAVWISGTVQREALYQKREWVTHTYEVQKQLETVLSTLRDAETEQRGYLLTGNSQYLDHFNGAKVNLSPAYLSCAN